jgi:hypothetical protein
MIGKVAVRWWSLWLIVFLCGTGAKHATPNFEVEAPTAAIAEKVALTAERCREELAIEWLGHKLPTWYKPCKVRVKVGQLGAGGATTFSFANGEVFGWDMTVQGSLERILDSVIPHEVSHTILACHFRRPLPRWADEGAATLAEESSERRRQQKLAEEVLPSRRRIPLRELLGLTEYPKNMQHVLTLYAEGFSLADFLVQKGGKGRFLAFLQDAHEAGWDAALRRHYEEANVESLEAKWSQWVIAGCPSLRQPSGTLLADAKTPSTVRSQNPETATLGDSPTTPPSETTTARNRDHNEEPLQAVAAGHSIRPRTELVVAPSPRMAARSGQSELPQGSSRQPVESAASQPRSPFRVVSSEPDVTADRFATGERMPPEMNRRPRAIHLTLPELRIPSAKTRAAAVSQTAEQQR